MAKDTRRRLLSLANDIEPLLAKAFLQSIQDMKARASLELLIKAIRAGDINAVNRILQVNEQIFIPLDDEVRAAFLLGGKYQFDSIPRRVIDPSTDGRLIVRFGGSQSRAQSIILRLSGNLITGLVEGQRDTIANILADGLANGINPNQTALELTGRVGANGRRTGGVIGLTDKDAKTVQSVRRGLERGDTKRLQSYLTLKGRDQRFDASIRRLISEGSPASRELADKITDRLSSKYLRNRGRNIARTETISALNAARQEATQQLLDRNVVSQQDVKRVWDATGDARTREDHLAMEGQTVAWGQPFIAPDGSQLMHPGDSSLGAPAKQTNKCRCYEQLKINWLARAV